MSKLDWIKITNRNAVVNLLCLAGVAAFAYPTGSLNCFEPVFPPRSPIERRDASLPSRMRWSNIEFALPFGGARLVTESIRAVEIRSRSCHVFTAPATNLRDAVSSREILCPMLIFGIAIVAAKSLRSAVASQLRAAVVASATRRLSPSIGKVAFARTELAVFTSILRMERFRAMGAYVRDICAFHALHDNAFTDILQHAIEINPDYCEIIRKRMAQRVFEFPV